jgi:lipopolysaccharide/colanic/teichoic acid biosynthesis glycosyltransferase
MRKLSMDELPQLLNILRGELSLVGPRPIVEDERRKYGNWGRLLLTVPPGLTGLWQVSGRSDTSYQQRVDFDLYYINNWSLGLDLLILARTIPAVLSRRGAY